MREGAQDAFVAKLNKEGTALVYSTYLGGSNDDGGTAIAIDAAGNAYVTGFTSSSNDFPTTPGAFQRWGLARRVCREAECHGRRPPLLHLSGRLEHRHQHGDCRRSGLSSARQYRACNAYVTGATRSDNFPTTPGAFRPTPVAQEDAFVTKLNKEGTALVYSTYLGGGRDESGNGIAVDTAGNAYVTGVTMSADFPTTPGAFQRVPLVAAAASAATSPDVFGDVFGDVRGAGSPAQDAFVAKLDPTGSALVYATYLSGTNADSGTAIAVDAAGNAYVTGFTASANFPTTTGALQTTRGAREDAFVTKLNATGSAPSSTPPIWAARATRAAMRLPSTPSGTPM